MSRHRRATDRLQIGPGGWHESPSAVWEDQDEPERAVAAHPAQDRQGLTFKWMPAPNNRDLRWKAIEVGSVALVRSTRSIGTGCGSSYGIGLMMGDSPDS